MQYWKKLGIVYEPLTHGPKGYTHGALPIVTSIEGSILKVTFSARDVFNRSIPFSLLLDMETLKILEVFNRPLLSLGAIGAFDDSGVMPSEIIEDHGIQRMFYIGWNKGETVPFRNSIGLAESYDGQVFERVFEGPILDRTRSEPYFTASCSVLKEKERRYRMWYLSCVGWFKLPSKRPMHRYHIKYAESENAIDWKREGDIAIDFEYENEYAISTPRVVKENGIYRMWYSYRASAKSDTYRIGYAESENGIYWKRLDNLVGLDVSSEGWDSEMICYPYIFEYKDNKYMLYNGNGYGFSGFGIARLVES